MIAYYPGHVAELVCCCCGRRLWLFDSTKEGLTAKLTAADFAWTSVDGKPKCGGCK